MADALVHIESVEKRGGGDYRVNHADEFGTRSYLLVAANDELDAYTKATKYLQRRDNLERHLIWAASLVLCLLIAVTGYSCSQPDAPAAPTNMERCVAQGGSYYAKDATTSTAGFATCILKGGTHAQEATT